MKVNFKVTKCLLPLPYWRFTFSKRLLGEGQFVKPKDGFVSKTSISFFNRAKCHHCYPWSRQCHFGAAHTWNLPGHIFQIFCLEKKTNKNTKIIFWKLQCLVEEGWHLATLFFLERLGVACLRRPMLRCKQYCLMHCHPLLFVQCLESPVGKRKRSMTVSTSQDPSFSGLNQVWTVSYSNLNPEFMCFIFVLVLLFLFYFFFWRM